MSHENQLDESTLIQHSQEWLNEHGQPSFSYLKRLVEDDTIESREELLELAQNNGVQYDHSTTMQELMDRIRLSMSIGPESP
jgi:hypothetical protein